MKSVLFSTKLRNIFMVGILVCATQVYAVDWLGGVITDADSNINTDFTIANENILEGPVRIKALTDDVTVTIGSGAVLKSANSPDDGRLHISAAANKIVIFDLSNWDLLFSGAEDGNTKLLVSFAGDGRLHFVLGDGKKVEFSADNSPKSAGTNFFVCMNDKDCGPVVLFERENDDSSENVEIVVGRDSCITYVAPRKRPIIKNEDNDKDCDWEKDGFIGCPGCEEGTIQFDPANLNNEGCMILRVKNCASVIIAGHRAKKDENGEFTNEDVKFRKLGGCAANFQICNIWACHVANLTVINENSVLPHLRSEPFCDDSFTGKLFGFILGANGVLTTENGTYLDYIGCQLNCCPRLGRPDRPDWDKDDWDKWDAWDREDCDFCNEKCDDCDGKHDKPDKPNNVPTVKRNFDGKDFDCDECSGDVACDCDCNDFDKPEPCDICGDKDGKCDCRPLVCANPQLVKERNPSAFFVDGVRRGKRFRKKGCDHVAHIEMEGNSGIYFRSGVDVCGDCREDSGFIINDHGKFKNLVTPGAGNIVFDVEGRLRVLGSSENSNVLRILSCQVEKSGCPVVIASEADCPNLTLFPKLTHAKNRKKEFLRYNKAAFLINNRMDLWDVSLLHTDKNHKIFERDNLNIGNPKVFSEPTYIGGEYKVLCNKRAPRPTIALHNSIIRFHESAGFTGVDIQVPNVCDKFGNTSKLKFYSNGLCVDKGSGRYVILGTDKGCRSCVSGKILDNTSHLDVFQICNQNTPAEDHVLLLQTCPNDPCFTVKVDEPVDPDQCSVQTIFLGNESNISIGTAPDAKGRKKEFCQATTPTVCIDGAFFSFETEGGSNRMPELSGTTGEGAIFVDQNGVFKNNRNKRASISTMVVRSCNGVVDLPKTEVFFDNRVGVTNWKPDLEKDNILVKTGECFSDYTIDWMNVKKDCEDFRPYDPKCTPLPCKCPPVTEENVTNLPTILGTVDQLQIKRSRIGDPVHVLVSKGEGAERSGFVRELVFLTGFNSAEAPSGVVVVEDFGRVGLGSAHRNVDSLEASIKLGINGVTIIANGNGVIELNEDVIIDNVCHILPGPNFGDRPEDTLFFTSEDEKELRVKSTGVLDVTMFRGPNQLIEFAGNIRLVFEPGAKLLLSDEAGDENRTHIRFTDTVSINFERVFDDAILEGTAPDALDNRLVKFIGNAEILMDQAAALLIPDDTFLGIETDPECTDLTDINWTLEDQARFDIGNDVDPGGTFQIGNRCDLGGTINFKMTLNGIGTIFQINRQGILGVGVGGFNVNSFIPNDWTYQCLENANKIAFDIQQGTMAHNQIFDGNNREASILVVGPSNTFDFSFEVINSRILGGGNIALLESCPLEDAVRSRAVTTCGLIPLAFNIVVESFNGQAPGSSASTGILASKDLLRDRAVFPTPVFGTQANLNLTSTEFYTYLTVLSHELYLSPKSTIAQNQLGLPTLGYVTNTTLINRVPRERIITSSGGDDADVVRSVRRGAVNINIDDNNGDINNVIEIRGAV